MERMGMTETGTMCLRNGEFRVLEMYEAEECSVLSIITT